MKERLLAPGSGLHSQALSSQLWALRLRHRFWSHWRHQPFATSHRGKHSSSSIKQVHDTIALFTPLPLRPRNLGKGLRIEADPEALHKDLQSDLKASHCFTTMSFTQEATPSTVTSRPWLILVTEILSCGLPVSGVWSAHGGSRDVGFSGKRSNVLWEHWGGGDCHQEGFGGKWPLN